MTPCIEEVRRYWEDLTDSAGGNKEPLLGYRLTSAKLYINFMLLQFGLLYIFPVNWSNYG